MEVSAKNIEKRPQRHEIVNEVLIVKLEVLVCFLDALRGFEGFTPVEQVTVLLRSN